MVLDTYPFWKLYMVKFLKDQFSSHSVSSWAIPFMHKMQSLFVLSFRLISLTFILFQVSDACIHHNNNMFKIKLLTHLKDLSTLLGFSSHIS